MLEDMRVRVGSCDSLARENTDGETRDHLEVFCDGRVGECV